MTAPKTTTFLAVSLLILTCSSGARAQEIFGPSHDLQFFSPVNFDFENNSIRKESGLFFSYDKLSWAFTGDRSIVGDPNVEVLSELIVPDELAEAFDVTSGPLPQQQHRIVNGLQDVPPFADFAWGERYELGYGNGDTSWMVGILDGPELSTHQSLGNGPGQLGFGSIHVNFETPEDFLLGFRDYWGTGEEGGFFILPTEVLGGPGEGADGIVDDLDGDGAEGAVFVVADVDGDGEIGDDEVVGIAVDLDDLHEFNITFDEMSIRNITETQGVELMKTHHLSNRHLPVRRQNEQLEIGYGVRFLRIRDEFSVGGTSPLLGSAEWETGTENQIVGPQIRAKWSKQQGRWTLGIDGRFLFGYNVTDFDQAGAIGLDDVDEAGVVQNPGLSPGAINRLLQGQPNVFSIGQQDNFFSPVVELRAQTSYQLTSAIAAKLGYTATFVDNISRAAAVTRYTLPDMGFQEEGKQDIFINGVNFGFDVVY